MLTQVISDATAVRQAGATGRPQMRRSRGEMVGLLVVLILSTTIIVEALPDQKRHEVELARTVDVPLRSEASIPSIPPEKSYAWLKEILSRPLFNSDRRQPAPEVQGIPGLPRLTAIIVYGSSRKAIFAAVPGGHNATVVNTGSRIGAYEVREISDDTVTVYGAAGQMTIRPVLSTAPLSVQNDPMPQRARSQFPEILKSRARMRAASTTG